MSTDLVQMLLTKRGITDPHDIERFLSPDYERDTHDPMLLQDMDRAVARVLAAIRNDERIVVYSDFDCDGIPGAALMHEFFAKIGYANFEVYIPHRDREGHGYHTGAIDTLAAREARLIITVDCGITAHESVAHARSLGIDTIITDHHEIVDSPPDAYAVINPKLGTYPFRDLCGAAVGWKLVVALIREGKKQGLAAFDAIPEGWEKWLLDLVGIATVADMVPLVGENRVLAHYGLKVLRKSPRAGIRALCTKSRIKQAQITEDDISFTFAPRINAASRMDAPELALRLLTTRESDEAELLAAELESLNRKRRGVVGAIVKEANSRIRARYADSDAVIVLGDPAWKPALLGLAANSIMGDRGGAVCLWGKDASGNIKGSCRSDGSISVVDLFSQAADAFIEFGGHKASGGFSISHDAIHTLPERLSAVARDIAATPISPRLPDAELSLRHVTTAVLTDVARLAPFGMGNPKPVFRFTRTRITYARQFGKEMNHTEVSLVCPESGVQCRAFQYFMSPMDFSLAPSPGTDADVLASIERDMFRGPDALVLRLTDILPSR